MLNCIANRHAKREQYHLRNDEECRSKDNVANRPSVVERAEDENKLRDNVDDRTNERPEEIDNP